MGKGITQNVDRWQKEDMLYVTSCNYCIDLYYYKWCHLDRCKSCLLAHLR